MIADFSKCALPWCDQEIGPHRRLCSQHVYREWEQEEHAYYTRYHYHVYATVGDDVPVVLIGVWKSSPEAYRQSEIYKGLEDPNHDNRPLIAWAINGELAMQDFRMIHALQRAWDEEHVRPRGGDLLMPEVKGKKSNKGGSKSGGPSLCLCGCGDMTGGGRFLPGHDAKLKGSLIGAVRQARKDGDKKAEKTAADRLTELGWTHFIPDAAKDEERAAKKREKVAKLNKEKRSAKKGGKAKGKAKSASK